MNKRAKHTIAVAQCCSAVGNVQANLKRARVLCAEARKKGAELVLFPECHATGYSYGDLRSLVLRIAEPADGPTAQRLSSLAKEFALAVCCGTIEREQGRFYNTHLVAFPDGRLERQRKGALNLLEQTVFSAEARRRAFEWNGLRFGILICADLSLPSYGEEFRSLGVELLLNPSAGRLDDASAKADHLLPVRLGQALARKLKLAYAVANPVGFSGEDFYPGNSWIMNRDGQTLVHLAAVTEPEKMRDSVGVETLEVGR